MDAAAHLQDVEHVLEITVAWHGSHEDSLAQGGVAECVVEVIPSAELLHDLFKRLVFKNKTASRPAAHHLGVGLPDLCGAALVAVLCLLTGVQGEHATLGSSRMDRDDAMDKRGDDGTRSIAVDVELRADDAQFLPAGLDKEGMLLVVRNLEVSLTLGFHASLLAVEDSGILQS